MTSLTRRGATVELAISAAMEALGVTRDEVEVEVIDKGKKGFLGFGAKEAEVTVTIIEVDEPSVLEESILSQSNVNETEPTIQQHQDLESDPSEEVITQSVDQEEDFVETISDETTIEETEHYLKAIAMEMKINDLQVKHEVKGKYITFKLESAKAAILIGKRGQTLNALQQLAQLVVNKSANEFKVVRIDIGDYRERREQSLEQLAERMADKAIRNGRKVQLEPMPSHERKVIHNALSNRLDIETYSEGSDPHRYLVIEPMR